MERVLCDLRMKKIVLAVIVLCTLVGLVPLAVYAVPTSDYYCVTDISNFKAGTIDASEWSPNKCFNNGPDGQLSEMWKGLVASGVANTQCAPYYTQCPCNQVPVPALLGGYKCVAGKNTHQCPVGVCQQVPSPGQLVKGVCVAPLKCEAVTATGLGTGGQGSGNVLDKGFVQLSQLLGQLMQRLLQNSGTQNPNCPEVPAVDCREGYSPVPGGVDTNGCQLPNTCQYTGTPYANFVVSPTSGPPPLAVTANFTVGSPCSPYTLTWGDGADDSYGGAPEGQSCIQVVTNSTKSHTYEDEGTYTVTFQTGSSEPHTATVEVTSSQYADFSVTPTSGTAPLEVTATFVIGSPCSAYTLKWGDGSDGSYAGVPDGQGCSAVVTTVTKKHTYTDADTYTIEFQTGGGSAKTQDIEVNSADNSSGGNTGQGYTINIGTFSPTSDSSSGNTANTQQQEKTGATPVFSNPVLNGQVYTAPKILGGPSGDIKYLNGGATFTGGTTDAESNSTVAGFYGSSFSGQPQGFVGRMCESRPWANNFLSVIVPPSFFDGLCTSRGYQVGPPPAPEPTLEQTPIQPQETPIPSQPTEPATSAAPRVDIWAVPASVPLNARTTVFWNTQGVVSCTVTSPDGSFSEDSLSGGAATVPLVGPTTFTISCLDQGGNPVTDYVTVNLSI